MTLFILVLLASFGGSSTGSPRADGKPRLLIQSQGGISCFSPDSRLAATQDHSNLIKIWRVAPARLMAERRFPGSLAYIHSFSRDGRSVFVLTCRPSFPKIPACLWQWNFVTDSISLVVQIPQMFNTFAMSPNGRWIALANMMDGGIYVIDCRRHLAGLIKTRPEVVAVAPGDDGSLSAAILDSAANRCAVIHFSPAGKEVSRVDVHSEPYFGPAFTRDRRLIVVSDKTSHVVLLDTHTGSALKGFESKAEQLLDAQFSADGRLVEVRGSSGPSDSIHVHELWKVGDGTLIARHVGTDIGGMDENLKIATIGNLEPEESLSAEIVDLRTLKRVAAIPQTLDVAGRVAVAASGRLLHIGLASGRTLVFDLARLAPTYQSFNNLSELSPDGKILLRDQIQGIEAIDWRSGHQLWITSEYRSTSISPDSRTVAFFPQPFRGNTIAFEGSYQTADLHDLQSGKKIRELTRFDLSHSCDVTFTPKGDLACTWGLALPITLWDTRTGSQTLRIEDDLTKEKLVRPVLVRNGWIAAIVNAGYLRIYDSKTGMRRWEKRLDRSDTMAELSTTDESRNIRVAFEDMTVEYDIRTGKRLAQYEPSKHSVITNRFIITPQRDGRISFWNRKDRQLTAELWLFRPLKRGDLSVEWLLKAGRYYTGSPGVEKHILWRKGHAILPGAAFAESLRNPKAVGRALGANLN